MHIERNPHEGQIVKEIAEVSLVVERAAARPSFSPLFRYEADRGLVSTGNRPMRPSFRAADLNLPDFLLPVIDPTSLWKSVLRKALSLLRGFARLGNTGD